MSTPNEKLTPEQEFVEQLSLASYHYADDTTKEWGQARECVRRASRIALDNGWDEDTVRELYISRTQLVELRQVRDAIKKMKEAEHVTNPESG